ncbi:HTH-type sugar sensing transcriptional regulator TrmB [Halomarina rubra]|uniref:HTH-type sugar sensing transcriptional regulator TrmB n=1 Tax=Halomarina rubra TaxID=2071873 RepID=A0ABD6ATJ2_9EURY|nr:TrmB family transcriptional regulator [Halomarina rubra]
MSSTDLRRTLELMGDRFDFGEYEIEAYLAVLDHGDLTASEIADHTDIPQPRVYDTVRKLSDRGMVEVRESRPMRVVALDPEDVFPSVQESLDELVTDLAARYTAPARDTEAVSLVKSRPSILRYLESVVESAEYELSCSLTPDLLDRFEAELAAAVSRGVSVELIVTPASDALSVEEFAYEDVATEVRVRRGITTPVMAVADGERSVYATQDALTDGSERYGVIFNRSALGFLVGGFFNTVLWTTAESLVSGGVEAFPRRYASIRRCLKDLREADSEFTVTVVGRDVLTGANRRVTGTVGEMSLGASDEVATLTVQTDDGPVSVGGRVAAHEDVEAHEIHVERADIGGEGA